MEKGTIFVCYSSKDKKEVDSLAIEAQKGSYEDLWVSHIDGVPTARNDEEYIINQIIKSKGAILMVSENFLNSEFINRVELPLIIKQQKERDNYHVSVLLVSSCDYSNNQYFKNRQFINSRSTTLNSVTPSQHSLILKEALSEFPKGLNTKYKVSQMTHDEIMANLEIEVLEEEVSELRSYKQKANKSFLRIFLVLLITFPLMMFLFGSWTTSSQESIENNSSNSNVGENIFLDYLNSNINEENVGDVILFSDYDFLNQAEWVCSLLDKGVKHYFLYDGLWFLVAENLTKYNAGEDMTADQMWGAVYFIFHGANDYLCDSTVNTDQLENKFNFHKNLTTDNYEWRSDLFNSQFKEGYLNNLYELLDNSNPSLSLLGYFDSQDEFYDLMIMGCKSILPLEPMDYLDYVEDRFSEAKNLEDQNVIWAFEEIVLFGVPTWFCPDQVEKGSRLSTYIYLVDFKY